jgi:hypothetical protein
MRYYIRERDRDGEDAERRQDLARELYYVKCGFLKEVTFNELVHGGRDLSDADHYEQVRLWYDEEALRGDVGCVELE